MRTFVPLAVLTLMLSVAPAHAQDSGIDIEQALTIHIDRIDRNSPLDQQIAAATANAEAAESGVEAASNDAAAPADSAEAQDHGEREQWGKDKEEEDSAPR